MSATAVAPASVQLLPASSILPAQVNQSAETDKLIHAVALQTIQALREMRYSAFDGVTTSNCCHGVALRTHNLIQSIDLSSLGGIESELQKEEISKLNLPAPLTELSKLFMLRYVRDESERTDAQRLRDFAPALTTSFCNKTIMRMQKKCADETAEAYEEFAQESAGTRVNSIAVETWAKYVSAPFLQKEKEHLFASNLYSMEVMMAHLIKHHSIVALISDSKQGRYVKFLRGNGKDNFASLKEEEASTLSLSTPVVVFGGCSSGDQGKLDFWANDLPGLALANDTHYPQFPPRLKSSDIQPEELTVKQLIASHAQIPGVTKDDRSLFFLAHLYPASLREIREGSLPTYKGPTK